MSNQIRKVLIVEREHGDGYNVMVDWRDRTSTAQVPHLTGEQCIQAVMDVLIPALRRERLQPKTGVKCSCRPGVWRANCPTCEGTGWVIDFAKIRAEATR